MLSAYLLIGLGAWAGLMAPKVDQINKENWKNYALGLLLTVPFWPLALYNNRPKS